MFACLQADHACTADAVKKSLNEELCREIQSSLVADGDKLLASLPTTVALDPYVDIDFCFLQAPVTTSSYLLTQHQGAFVPRATNSTLPPFLAGPLPTPTNTTRMFYVFLNEYLVNSVRREPAVFASSSSRDAISW